VSEPFSSNQHDDLSRALADLLASDLHPEAFTRQLVHLNIEQARSVDPELPDILRACAIPRQFDEEVIGVLRDAPQDRDTSKRLLNELLSFSFVKERKMVDISTTTMSVTRSWTSGVT